MYSDVTFDKFQSLLTAVQNISKSHKCKMPRFSEIIFQSLLYAQKFLH